MSMFASPNQMMSRIIKHHPRACHDRLMPCLFCQIITGEVAGLGFYEDQHTVGIMDLRQPGWPDVAHLLILPRQHVALIDQMTDRDAATLMASVVKVAKALRRVCDPAGISLWQSNGEAAGQEVPHVHVHLLTRTRGDGLLRVYPSSPQTPSMADTAPLAHELRDSLMP